MRLVALTTFVAAAIFSTAAPAEPASHARLGTVPVDVVAWRPRPPSFSYDQLAISPQRRAFLVEQNVSIVSLLYRVHLHVGADGIVEEVETRAGMYLNRIGIEDFGDIRFTVDAHSENAAIEQAYTLLPDGRRIGVEPGSVQVLVVSEDLVFTDDLDVVLPLVGLEPGAIGVLVTKIRHRTSASPLPWSRLYYPQSTVPREAFELRLTWDEGAIRPDWRHDFAPLDCRDEGERAVVCRATNIAAFTSDPDMEYLDEIPSLVVAEPTTWPALATIEWRLAESAFADGAGTAGAAIDATSRKLTAGIEIDEEKLDRLSRFVSQEIRYLGLEHGTGGVVPRSTATTLERRFGDCKDKAVLFADLARRSGLQVHLVLTSAHRQNLAKLLLPATAYFDHMVACVRTAAGADHCVDLTDPFSAYDASSGSLNGGVRLDLTGTTEAPTRFPTIRYQWTMTVETENAFTRDGSVTEQQKRWFLGPYAAYLRSGLRQRQREERQQFATQQYHRYISEWVNPRFRFLGVDDVRRPLDIASEATYANIYQPGEPVRYRDIDPWLHPELWDLKSENTAHDYVLEDLRRDARATYTLPSGYRLVGTGPALDFVTPYGEMRRRYRVSGARVHVETTLSLPRARIPVAEIPAFNRFLDILVENSDISFTAEPTNDG